MYKYTGYPELGKSLEKEFSDKEDAIEFADENSKNYPEFKIVDEDGDEVYSPKIVHEEEKMHLDNMFPDEGSEDGFDWTKE